MLSAEIERVLNLMSFPQTELAKNELMAKAENLVNDHFEQTYDKNNALTSSQLNNLEGVAFTTFSKADIQKFIQKQAGKENPNKPDNKWTHNNLDEYLLETIDAIADNDVDFVRESLIQQVQALPQEAEIDDDSVTAWFTSEQKAEVEIKMVRSFLTYFATYYEYVRKKKGLDGTEGDER